MKKSKKKNLLAAKSIIDGIYDFIDSGETSALFVDNVSGLQVSLFYLFTQKYEEDLYNIAVDIYDNNTGKVLQICDKLLELYPKLGLLPFYGTFGSGEIAVNYEPISGPAQKTKKVPKGKNAYFYSHDYTEQLSRPGTQVDPAVFDLDKLSDFCGRPIVDFWRSPKGYTSTTPFGKYHFTDNGSKILAVAHLDTVFPDGDPKNYTVSKTGNMIDAVNLDDRLGAYIITDILPKLGIKVDVLLTEGEEVGMSTAAYFNAEKKYNWMFQFDRAGTDVVTYHYKNPTMIAALEKMGFFVGFGSFSDISFMDTGVCGINFGVAYYDNHSPYSFMLLDQTLMMIGKFLDFYKKYQFTRFEYDEKPDPMFAGRANLYNNHVSIIDVDPVLPEDEIYYCINCGFETNNPDALHEQLCDECLNWLYA